MCLKLSCEYELHILLNTKVNAAKDHGQNYMKVRPPPVRHFLRNRLLSIRLSTLKTHDNCYCQFIICVLAQPIVCL